MGAWGVEPWDNDEAADWFGEFFSGIDVDARIEAALKLNDDNYDEIRAACYLLQVLGRIYVWPGDLDKLGGLLGQGIELLERMTAPGDEICRELQELWGADAEVFESIGRQLKELKLRRSEGNWD